MDAPGGFDVPRSQIGRDDVRGDARGEAGASGAEVGVELIPDVAHRGVDVGEVRRVRRRLAALGDGVAGRDDQVVAGEIERLDGAGEERQVVTPARRREREALEEAGGDSVALDDRAGGVGHVDQREDVRGRVHQAELLEDALAAAQAGEPVVHQRDPHRPASR